MIPHKPFSSGQLDGDTAAHQCKRNNERKKEKTRRSHTAQRRCLYIRPRRKTLQVDHTAQTSTTTPTASRAINDMMPIASSAKRLCLKKNTNRASYNRAYNNTSHRDACVTLVPYNDPAVTSRHCRGMRRAMASRTSTCARPIIHGSSSLSSDGSLRTIATSTSASIH